MKSFFSVLVLMFAFSAAQAEAFWQCTYTCGSRGQEPKIGRGWSQPEARRDAQRQICTRYEGGYPKYFQGCEWQDDHGGGGGGYYEIWECTYSCGSRGQEPKVGRGYDQRQAARDAQRQICTRYEGGHPKYFQGCRRTQ
jgi:hypothetical protein